jgi:2-oxoglutarate ferredoxin oxidoreductase subunit delta
MAAIRGDVVIKLENCKGCELCVIACPPQVLGLSPNINKQGYHYAVLIEDGCTGCINCALVCPDAVITVYREDKKSKQKTAVAEIRNVTDSITVKVGDEGTSVN